MNGHSDAVVELLQARVEELNAMYEEEAVAINGLRARVAELEAAMERLMDPIWPQSVIEIARTALSTPQEES